MFVRHDLYEDDLLHCIMSLAIVVIPIKYTVLSFVYYPSYIKCIETLTIAWNSGMSDGKLNKWVKTHKQITTTKTKVDDFCATMYKIISRYDMKGHR